MGALLQAAARRDSVYHMPTYARKPVMFVRGAGMRLFDDDGSEYLDFVSGIGAVNLGHAHPGVASAVAVQSATLIHVSNLYHVEHRSELAERLARLAGGENEEADAGFRAFFCNSGAEATEGAIKLARRWSKQHKGDSAFKIITAERSFHGRTLAALAATGQPSKQDAFQPLPEGFVHVPLNDVAALDAALDESVCAVMLEPVQGEGGVYPCSQEYLAEARRLCDERRTLLILDEVQTGFFRTGPAFAFHGYGVRPDIITLAKGIANGLPMGAILAEETVATAFSPGDHGSTFAGGPVLCAAALATIDALEKESLGENAERVGAYMRSKLTHLSNEVPVVVEVRGRGLMNAVELSDCSASAIVARLLERRLVVNNIGESVLRFLPPLVCSEEEVDRLVEVLHEVLTGEEL